MKELTASRPDFGSDGGDNRRCYAPPSPFAPDKQPFRDPPYIPQNMSYSSRHCPMPTISSPRHATSMCISGGLPKYTSHSTSRGRGWFSAGWPRTNSRNINLESASFDDVNMKDVRIDNANIEGLKIYGYDIHELIQPLLERDHAAKRGA